ncbi:MAG: LytTR family transcriptional regulator DNA-binding domain-containing protein [Oscillospiraceae bacterium]|jgi:DNA-binding LytR/AlgR family response regulator|nr:LytTR family transcriptional regulator DNA-binding domain-containing protein [Oscillospiraceae bacterium]
MKIRIEHAPLEENEVILRCTQLDDEMLRVLSLLRSGMQKLLVWNEHREMLPLSVSKVVYCETVEEKTFVYTHDGIYQTALSLAELEDRWGDLGLFRAGKSSVVNLHEIQKLKNCGSGRIEALLTTGEKMVISRRYAPILRERLGL